MYRSIINMLFVNNNYPEPFIALTIFIVLVLFIFLSMKYKLWRHLLKGEKITKKEQIEDILKQLYYVENGGRYIDIFSLSGVLKLNYKQLILILEAMTRAQLIKIVDDNINLTAEGKDYALKIIRIHRLWEKYLSEKTGFDKLEWHNRADTKEHILTTDETDVLYQALGSPRFDPHGKPIPTDYGEMLESKFKPLSSIKTGSTVKIMHIEDQPEIVFKQILKIKLHRGSQLKITNSNAQKMDFYCEGQYYSVSPIIASNIHVTELNSQELFEEQLVRLTSLKNGETATIVDISSECRGIARHRLMDLGFTPGSKIKNEFSSPNKNPKAYNIRNTLIALRNDQAELVLIEKEK